MICDAPVTEPKVEADKPQPSKSKKSRSKQTSKSATHSKSTTEYQVRQANKTPESESRGDTESKPRSGGRGEINFF